MFAGHIGVAMAAGRVQRQVNVGVFVFAAMLLDVLLWLFVLLGWESVSIPADFEQTHQARFVFPYSHGLLAGIGWSALAAVVAYRGFALQRVARIRISLLVALAVFSHWILDAMVHVPELPIAGPNSLKVGLGLWQDIPVALVIEAVLVVGGLVLFVRGSHLSRARGLSLGLLTLVVLAFTVAGMTVASPPPSGEAMAASSLATIAVVCTLAGWIARRLG